MARADLVLPVLFFLLSIMANLAFTSFFTSEAGSGLWAGKRIVPLLVS